MRLLPQTGPDLHRHAPRQRVRRGVQVPVRLAGRSVSHDHLPLSLHRQRVLHVVWRLQRAGQSWVTRREVAQASGLNASDLSDCWSVLIGGGFVERHYRSPQAGGSRYRLTAAGAALGCRGCRRVCGPRRSRVSGRRRVPALWRYAKSTRPRGLCWGCYYRPGIRQRYGSVSQFAQRSVGRGHRRNAPLPAQPTAPVARLRSQAAGPQSTTSGGATTVPPR